MIGVPTNLQAISPVLANYNFTDIAAGTGFINFYAGNTVDLKLLSNFTYYSDVIVDDKGLNNVANYTLFWDDDYDTIINRPLDVRGLGIVQIPYAIRNTGGATESYGYCTVTLRKVSGGLETDVCSNDSRVHHNSSATFLFTMLSVDLNCPLTHFKIGDTLRLSLQFYGKTASAYCTMDYAHDPKNRTTGWDSTGAVPSQLVFQCPVRLNL